VIKEAEERERKLMMEALVIESKYFVSLRISQILPIINLISYYTPFKR
jgi:hypothetical protein